MVYTPPEYPAAIPDYNEIWPWADDVDDVNVAAWDAMVKEFRAVMTELGTTPKGGYGDVATAITALEAFRAAGHTNYRGDPAAYDRIIGDFVADGTWRELDLPTIAGVPVTATEVNLHVEIRDNLVATSFGLRRDNQANTFNIFFLRTQVANVYIDGDPTISCLAGKIEYFAQAGIDKINLTVKGWKL